MRGVLRGEILGKRYNNKDKGLKWSRVNKEEEAILFGEGKGQIDYKK